MKFRLVERDAQNNKVGSHYVGNKKYVAGQIIESDTDLCKKFRNKFERVDDAAPASRPEIVQIVKMRTSVKESPKSQPGADGAVQEEGGTGAATGNPPSSTLKEDKPKTVKAKKAAHPKYGVDITDDFPDAIVLAMKVYQDDKTGSTLVIDPESDQVLKRAKNVTIISKFLKSQLG